MSVLHFFLGLMTNYIDESRKQLYTHQILRVENSRTAGILICRTTLYGNQARRQDSVTGGAEKNLGGAREVYLCEFERGTGAREIYPSLDQMNKERTKDSKGFSGQNREFKRFFRLKTGDLRKKKVFIPKMS